MNKMEKWRLDEQRRLDQRRRDDLKLADMRAADERARIELRHADRMRLVDMRAGADPATREIGEKVQMVLDSRDRQIQRDRERTPVRAQEEPDPHMDPGWLARWEREGAMITLDPAEREKLREIERGEQQHHQEPDHIEEERAPERAQEPKAAGVIEREQDEDEDLEM